MELVNGASLLPKSVLCGCRTAIPALCSYEVNCRLLSKTKSACGWKGTKVIRQHKISVEKAQIFTKILLVLRKLERPENFSQSQHV